MADNIAITAGAGTTLATDDIGGVHHQRVKVGFGADGSFGDVSAANPIPVAQVEAQTWVAIVNSAAFATSKWHFTIYNSGTSVLKIRKVVPFDTETGLVTGTGVRLDLMTISTAPTSGTDITPLPFDTANTALSGIAVKTGSTATGVALLWPYLVSNDEVGGTNSVIGAFIQQISNLFPSDPKTQPYTLRQNQGIGLTQITASTIGQYSWAIFFTVE